MAGDYLGGRFLINDIKGLYNDIVCDNNKNPPHWVGFLFVDSDFLKCTRK